MCDGPGDGAAPVWAEAWRIAAKPHECSGCLETIPDGAEYRTTSVLHDGYWTRWKHCWACTEILANIELRLHQAGRPEAYTMGTLDLDCGISWHEAFGEPPPLSVEALAFTLPSRPGS